MGAGAEGAAAAAGAVAQSPGDAREYRAVALPGGLRGVLVRDASMAGAGGAGGSGSDSEASEPFPASGSEGEREGEEGGGGRAVKQAAAALCVGVGSFSDPEGLPGLSHFLEHMLFMGSEAFPDENAYDAYLSKHGGYSNAYTDTEQTVYYFEVQPSGLRGALERFSGFFRAPLCLEGSAEREIKAIDSEYGLALQSDGNRLQQLRCHTARRGHPYRIFGWGNKQSLWDDPAAAGRDPYPELLKYYGEQYSAERMTLAVLGAEPLDELEAWVRELFSGVPAGRAGPPATFHELPPPFEAARLYRLHSVREKHGLHVTFQLPNLHKSYRKKVEDYVSHLIGHEGPGSLLSALKARGWVSDLGAGVGEDGYDKNSNCFIFGVSFTLTEAGARSLPAGAGGGAGGAVCEKGVPEKAVRGHPLAGLGVLDLLFAYLNMLRREGPQRWVWDEMATAAAMKFRYLEEEDPSDYVTGIATNLQRYPPEHCLSADFLHDEWDSELVGSILGLLVPGAARVDLQSSFFKGWVGLDQEEPWFKIPYSERELPPEVLEAWSSHPAVPELQLPPRNDFLPTDFSLVDSTLEEEAAARRACEAEGLDRECATAGVLPWELRQPPSLAHRDDLLTVWHKLDRHFKTPRACAFFALTSPLVARTPRDSALCQLFMKFLEDDLKETTYLADMAYLHSVAYPEGFRISLRVDGFSHKLPVLCDRILQSIVHLRADPKRFTRVHEDLARKLRNSLLYPARHVSANRLYALRPTSNHVDNVLAELMQAGPADVDRFARGLLGSVHVECFCHGNLSQEQALSLGKGVRARLAGGPGLRAPDLPRHRVVALEAGSAYLHRCAVRNPEETNSALENYYQLGPDSAEQRAMLMLLAQVASEPCFDTLRTKEQLGYHVHCGYRLTDGVLGFCVQVVSDKYDPAHLDERVEAFLGSLQRLLAEMTGPEFEEHREAVVEGRLQQDQSLYNESDRLWHTILNHRRDFTAREVQARALLVISLADLRGFYAAFLDPEQPARRKMSLQVFGCNSGGPEGRPAEVAGAHARLVHFEAPASVHSALPLFPLAP